MKHLGHSNSSHFVTGCHSALLLALILLTSWPLATQAQSGATQSTSQFESVLADRAIGRVDAPLTIELFSVLVCGPCATYWKENYANLKQNYIDTGKARLIVRDVPWGIGTDRVSLLVRSATSSEQAFTLMSHLFSTQAEWVSKGNRGLEYVKHSALQAGYPEEAIEAALENQELMRRFQTKMKADVAKYGVKHTPTIVINGKVFASGQMSFATLRKELDRLLLPIR